MPLDREDFNSQIERIIQEDPGELLVHLRPHEGIFVSRHLDAICLDRNEDEKIQCPNGGPNPGKPLFQVKRIRFLVSQKVPKKVDRAAIEQNISRPLLGFEQLHRATKLLKEVFQARRRRELVTFFLQQVVWLIDDPVLLEPFRKIFNERRLTCPVCAADRDAHGSMLGIR